MNWRDDNSSPKLVIFSHFANSRVHQNLALFILFFNLIVYLYVASKLNSHKPCMSHVTPFSSQSKCFKQYLPLTLISLSSRAPQLVCTSVPVLPRFARAPFR